MKPDDVLEAAVADVLAGRSTPAERAALYPQAPDLQACLAAATAMQAARALALNAAGEQRIEGRLLSRLRSLPPVTERRWLGRGGSQLGGRRMPVSLRWVAASGLIAALLLAGVGASAAASTSNPGDLLYGLKRADENAQVFLSPSSERAFVYTSLAQHRLVEINLLVQRGRLDPVIVNNLSADLTAQTAAALAFVDETPPQRQAALLNSLVQVTHDQQTSLAALQQAAPPETRPGLDRAIEASRHSHSQAVERLEQVLAAQGGANSPTPSPSPTPAATQAPTQGPPGQTKVPPGQTQQPPGQTHVPPGQTKVPPGQTKVPPGQTKVPPGQTKVPPGQTRVQPDQAKTPRPPGGPHP